MKNEADRRNRIILQKMIDYCDTIGALIERFNNSFELYETDMAFQLSCNMCIIQLGELSARLPEDFKAQNAQIPWRLIKAMRNIHTHEYERVDLKLMWRTLTKEIPALKTALQSVLTQLKQEQWGR